MWQTEETRPSKKNKWQEGGKQGESSVVIEAKKEHFK
jgi:hypothetical protein